MGIKHLWTILTPFGERKPLYELEGKTVAVDLSCWICEAQNITDYYIQPKMYLRNLYFRTCYLLLMDVNPVFVLEGKAPELKYGTIAARNAIQFKGAKPRTDGVKVGKDRSRFKFVLQSCEEMLGYMGLACVKGNGEAEALCAYLNQDNLVDGCISQDSDCFAYGAKVVYRNFSISQQGAHAGTGGAVDVYDIDKINKELNFGRNKIIALALLCGSDYSDGVFGVGKEAAMKLFQNVPDSDILDRLRSWRTNEKLYDEMYRTLMNKKICTSCGHSGALKMHTRLGCKDCITTKGCDSSKFRDKRLEIKNEIGMRGKAIADPSFPNEELVKEFLVPKENIKKHNLQWKQPDLANFIKFTVKHLQWEQLYAFEKFLPVLTRWQLLNSDQILQLNNCKSKTTGVLVPDRIKKIRNPKGIPSYEIIWADKEDCYKTLIPPDQLEGVNVEKLWSTIEPQGVVCKAHPDLVSAFEQSKIKKKAPKRPRKPKNTIDAIDDMLANTSFSEPKPKKSTRKTKPKCKPVDSYFKKAVLNSFAAENKQNLLPEANDSFDLDLSKFGDENDLDLSDIVQEIVNRPPPVYVQENIDRLGYYVVDGGDCGEMNKSSFFITEAIEDDLFEKTMNYKALSDSSGDENDLQEHKLSEENKQNERDSSDDSFSDEYVPLLERLPKAKAVI